jgi:hypothetical protein
MLVTATRVRADLTGKHLIEVVPVLDAAPQSVERRRARRIENVSPALIPLLRGDSGLPPELRPATGIAISLVISGLIWFAIGCIIHFG